MIAAAAAAMVSGVFAVPTYDFSANVKTTSARTGMQISRYQVYLGEDSLSGLYWYDVMTKLDGTPFADWNDAKMYVMRLSMADKADYAAYVLMMGGVMTGNTITWGEQTIYQRRRQWCGQFMFTERDDDCYRVAGSLRLSGDVTIDGCCTGVWEFTDESYVNALEEGWLLNTQEITPLLLVRFGGLTPGMARSVEFAGDIGQYSFYQQGGFGYGVWALAGQGQWDVNNDRISSINGDIVGIIAPPECDVCCGQSGAAICFICDPVALDDYLDYEIDPDYDIVPDTAAFGTWSLRYNARKSGTSLFSLR